jgi:hypothetical protein
MNQIQAYEQIKKDLELRMKSGIITMGDITALNAVNSALADLYKPKVQRKLKIRRHKQLLQKVS